MIKKPKNHLFIMLIACCLCFPAFASNWKEELLEDISKGRSEEALMNQLILEPTRLATERDKHFKFLAQYFAKLIEDEFFREVLHEHLLVKYMLSEQLQKDGYGRPIELDVELRTIFKEYIERIMASHPEVQQAQGYSLYSLQSLNDYLDLLNDQLINQAGLANEISDFLIFKFIPSEQNIKNENQTDLSLKDKINRWFIDAYNEIFVAYFPMQEDSEQNVVPEAKQEQAWSKYELFDVKGTAYTQSSTEKLAYPLLVVGIDERKSMMVSMVQLNKLLKQHKLGISVSSVDSEAPININFMNTGAPNALSVSRITEFLINRSLKEPYIKGSPELYAIVFGLCGEPKQSWRCSHILEHQSSRARIQSMPPKNDFIPSDKIYLQTIKELGKLYSFANDYHTSEPLIIWEQFDFSEVTILFFEHDSLALNKLAEYLNNHGTTGFETYPTAGATTRLVNHFLFILSNRIDRDDDDLLDQFNNINRDNITQSWKGWGQSSNVMMRLSRDFIYPKF